jgi:transcriptional regulator with XRE-family HTH domain
MATGDSPAVARRRLRIALRKAREAKGLTQGQVADALVWSLSKVNRIESGEVTISNTDLDAMLRLFGIQDQDIIDGLTADARAARRRGWWDESRYREHLTPATLQLLQFESQASAIRAFQIAVFPGLLQTRDYAASVIGEVAEEMPQETRGLRLEVRMRRQEEMRRRSDPPQLYIILDEFIPQRTMGTAEIMAEQLRMIGERARKPNVHLRMLPSDEGVYALIGAFNIYDIGDEENAVLYREGGVDDEFVHTVDRVRRYRLRFEQMWKLCLKEEATLSVIEAQYAAIRAALHRGE